MQSMQTMPMGRHEPVSAACPAPTASLLVDQLHRKQHRPRHLRCHGAQLITQQPIHCEHRHDHIARCEAESDPDQTNDRKPESDRDHNSDTQSTTHQQRHSTIDQHISGGPPSATTVFGANHAESDPDHNSDHHNPAACPDPTPAQLSI